MNYYKKHLIILSSLVLVATVSPLVFFKPITSDTCNLLNSRENIPPLTSQMLVVKSISGFRAEISACELRGKSWHHVLATQPFPAVIGKHGLALSGTKKEGDLKTPAGLYPLLDAFGSQVLSVKMDYKYITASDKFIDDVNSPSYNTWVNGKTSAKSFESMLIPFYKMGIIVGYNINPIIKGAGSAIFIHLWKTQDTPTSGCIATNELYLSSILKWLDKAQQPYVYIMN